jgi:hypothetical protein
LAIAAVGTLARSAFVTGKARLAGIAIVRHRSLCEVAALMGFDDNATITS